MYVIRSLSLMILQQVILRLLSTFHHQTILLHLDMIPIMIGFSFLLNRPPQLTSTVQSVIMSTLILGGASLVWVAVGVLILVRAHSIGIVMMIPRVRIAISARALCIYLKPLETIGWKLNYFGQCRANIKQNTMQNMGRSLPHILHPSFLSIIDFILF